ncbi:MAG: glycosyltransferase [Verrucomicrobiales bacterium]|nr:glycosyltransferase [Verrucomicrobiales bacterium]
MRVTTHYAIIIPAYNEEALLAGTIAAARLAMASIPQPGELIVVNNNSTDRTGEVAEEGGADLVVFEPHNQIARARNAGAEKTEAPLLVFVDADTQIEAGTLQTALGNLESGKIAAGGARIVMDQPVIPIVGWLTDNWNRVGATFNFAAGSFFYCRRDAFEAGGGFDESVYAGEEVWLAKRIKKWARKQKMGFEVIQNPPVLTSGRKSDWFSTWDFVRQLAIIFLIPGATRSRKMCQLWYKRPG